VLGTVRAKIDALVGAIINRLVGLVRSVAGRIGGRGQDNGHTTSPSTPGQGKTPTSQQGEQVTEEFSMEGHQHTLQVTHIEHTFDVKMASYSFKELNQKIDDTIRGQENIIAHVQDAATVQRAQHIVADLTGLKSWVEGEKTKRTQTAKVLAKEVKARLVVLGTKWSLSDLSFEDYHTLYEPKDLKEARINPDGSVVWTYTTHGGASFEVTVGQNKVVRSIQGTHLKFKAQAGVTRRGRTDDGPMHARNLYLNNSHMIADEFLGSGYTTSLNLITTSAYYNQEIMRGQERRIAATIRDSGADEFDMDVVVTWGEFNSEEIVTQIMNSPLGQHYQGNRTLLKQKIENFLIQYETAIGKRSKLKRCLDVKYSWTLKRGGQVLTKNGKPQQFGPESIGPDLWAGHWESAH